MARRKRAASSDWLFPGIAASDEVEPQSSLLDVVDRVLNKGGAIGHIPSLYHEIPGFSTHHHHTDVCIIRTTPMDSRGFFNYGICNDCQNEMIPNAKMLIVEVNETMPRCLGGLHESVHISEVDYIVESDHEPIMTLPPSESSDNDRKIAGYIIHWSLFDECQILNVAVDLPYRFSLSGALGQSGNPFSPHYDDFLGVTEWNVPFTREKVFAGAKSHVVIRR
jgi:hypothetical protein